MKRVILLSVLAIGLSSTLFAQHPAWGVRAGINMAKWKMGDELPGHKTSFNAGPEVGIFSEIEISPAFTLRPELLYAAYGSKYIAFNNKAIYKANYLVVPVLATFKLMDGFSLYAGPQAVILLKAESTIYDVKNDFKEYMKGFSFFAVAGAEYAFRNGISATLRYTYGLGSSERDAETTLKNRAFSFGMGYKLSELVCKKH